MSHLVRRLAVGVSTAVVACGVLLTVPGAASATSTTPPWEPDGDSVGGLLFFDSSGQQITGGSIDDAPLAAYVEGTSAVRANDTKATLFGYLPVNGQVPGQWQGEAIGASTVYPNGSAPAPLSSVTLPVETGAANDESIATLAADFPNNDTSSDGYAGIYQLRLRTSAMGLTPTTTYDSADIQITGDTWSVVYPLPTTATTTTLAVSPASPVLHGKAVKLTATVTPADATGSVKFLDGSTVLSTVAVVSGSATYTTSALKDGTHKLTAEFVPGSGFATSTSSAHSLTVKAQATSVTLSASSHKVHHSKKLTLTAKEAPAVAGTVTFLDGSKKLASVKVSNGKAVYSTTKLKVGTHSLKAKFTPTNTQSDSASTSKSVTVKVVK
jgi:hypothetical protein